MSGLDITFKVLARTENASATAVLIAAVDRADHQVQEAAIRTLLERRSLEGHVALLQRWDALSERWRAQLAQRSERLYPALRETILDTRPHVSQCGCAAAISLREYQAIPSLLAVAETRTDVAGDTAASALLALADTLYDELASPRNYRERRDPQLIYQHVISALENVVVRHTGQGRPEVFEAFVLLAKSDNGTLRCILEDERHPRHAALREILRVSPRPGVIHKILKLLERGAVPGAIIEVVGRRRDVPFLRRLAKLLSSEAADGVRRGLSRVTAFEWLDDLHVLHALTEAEQQAMMEIAALSSAPRGDVLHLIEYMLDRGNVGGRRSAVAALQQFRSGPADRLVLRALEDPDPLVQAQATRLLRSRSIPDALRRLIQRVDHPHAQVRQAARESLAEFNFQRYVQAFDLLDPEVRETTGLLVRKIDPDTVPQLAAELASPSRMRRLRALQMATLMEAVVDVEAAVIDLLKDADPFLRAEAARALNSARSLAAQHALRLALQDESGLVQEIAGLSLANMFCPLPAPPTLDSRLTRLPSLEVLNLGPDVSLAPEAS